MDETDFQRTRIRIAIHSLTKANKPLAELAAEIGLSEFHFQREFKRFTGLSPKQFSQFISKERLLAELKRSSVLNAAYAVGLSSSSRAHELILNSEGVTPGDVRNGGCSLTISYAIVNTLLGDIFAAWTGIGLCALHFIDDSEDNLAELNKRWQKATFVEDKKIIEPLVKAALNGEKVAVHIKGTNFQLRVWQALMQLTPGTLVSYQQVAKALGLPNASRAVGNAVGMNPVCLVIPCHRVIRESGILGGYRYSTELKSVILAREFAHA